MPTGARVANVARRRAMLGCPELGLEDTEVGRLVELLGASAARDNRKYVMAFHFQRRHQYQDSAGHLKLYKKFVAADEKAPQLFPNGLPEVVLGGWREKILGGERATRGRCDKARAGSCRTGR